MILDCSSKTAARFAVALMLLLPVALSRGPAYAHDNPAPPPSARKAQAAAFVLRDQENQRFDSAQLRGKITVLDFIFTTCTDVCPIFTANLAQIQRKLNGRYGGELFFVSITTDPEIDSAKVLKGYGQRYDVDFRNWAFLTGSPAQLKEVWRGFGITVIRRGRGLIQHTSLTTVIDRGGTRRFDYIGEKWRAGDLERDILTLLDGKS